MSKRASFKQADLTRVLRGVKAAGMEARSCSIDPVTGKIDILFMNDNGSKHSGNSFDEIAGR